MKRTIQSFAIFSGLAIIMTGRPVAAQDWPQRRGSGRDAKAAGFIPPKTWPQQFNQKWKLTVGQADATPALVGGRLYVFARQGGTR